MDGVTTRKPEEDLDLGHDIDRREDLRSNVKKLRRTSTFGEMIRLKSKIQKGNSASPEVLAELKMRLQKEFSSPN